MLANTITLIRLPLTFAVIVLFGRHSDFDVVLIAGIVFIFSLDALDGYIARKRNETSDLGAALDTIADRIIENTFWIYFAVAGTVPLWIPLTVMTRGIITDVLQRSHGYPTDGWTHALTRSRISRALYGAVKVLAFISLASVCVFNNSILKIASHILSTLAVSFCLLRGLSFFFIRKSPCPPNI